LWRRGRRGEEESKIGEEGSERDAQEEASEGQGKTREREGEGGGEIRERKATK